MRQRLASPRRCLHDDGLSGGQSCEALKQSRQIIWKRQAENQGGCLTKTAPSRPRLRSGAFDIQPKPEIIPGDNVLQPGVRTGRNPSDAHFFRMRPLVLFTPEAPPEGRNDDKV